MEKNKIKILLNGKKYLIGKDKNIDDLVKDLNLKNKSFALAINGEVVKKEAFDVELVVQNIGQGTAKNVKVNLTIPQNIFVMDGEINTAIPVLEAGASKVIACQMIANNNYSSSEITIKADLSESYRKYAEDKSIVIKMDQVVSSNKLSLTAKEEQKKAEKAALSTAKYLWNFLSGMTAKHNLQVAA